MPGKVSSVIACFLAVSFFGTSVSARAQEEDRKVREDLTTVLALKNKACGNIVEFERRREYAFSAGDGGQAGAVNPEFSRATAKRRLAEAQSLGIRTLVTECPHAYHSLSEVAPAFDISICSLTELLNKAI